MYLCLRQNALQGDFQLRSRSIKSCAGQSMNQDPCVKYLRFAPPYQWGAPRDRSTADLQHGVWFLPSKLVLYILRRLRLYHESDETKDQEER